jgi:serine/threonine-protein kinase RsbW
MIIAERFPSKLEAIPGLIAGVLEKLRSQKLAEEDLFNIKLSLEESLVNAVKYGNNNDPGLFVDFSLEIKGDLVTIKIKDQGSGFDFANVLDPTREENLERTSGRGIFLIKSLMDKVEYSEGGSRITMQKSLKRS